MSRPSLLQTILPHRSISTSFLLQLLKKIMHVLIFSVYSGHVQIIRKLLRKSLKSLRLYV